MCFQNAVLVAVVCSILYELKRKYLEEVEVERKFPVPLSSVR